MSTTLFDPGRGVLAALLLARASGFVAAAPFLGEAIVPMKVRALFAGVLALALFGISRGPVPDAPGLAQLALLVASEAAIGAAIGLLARLMLLAFEMAGEIVAVQMGFGMAAVMDPLGGHRSTIVGRWLWLAGIALFLTLGGHHLLLRAFGASLAAFPVGHPFPVDEAAQLFSRATAETFAAAVRIVAPVIGALLLATMGLGILARTVPQMNVFVVGFPVKIAVGIFALALALPLFTRIAQGELTRLAARFAAMFAV
jgi:flagellar biosynthetic protein FliR